MKSINIYETLLLPNYLAASYWQITAEVTKTQPIHDFCINGMLEHLLPNASSGDQYSTIQKKANRNIKPKMFSLVSKREKLLRLDSQVEWLNVM